MITKHKTFNFYCDNGNDDDDDDDDDGGGDGDDNDDVDVNDDDDYFDNFPRITLTSGPCLINLSTLHNGKRARGFQSQPDQ